MGLVVVACPQSESELAVMQCALEARGVHFFVQGGGFGSLWPGPQISAYNARRIMVPSSEVSVAREALAPLIQPEPDVPYHRPGFLGILRMIVEFFLFGWFVPGKRKRKDEKSDDASGRTTR
ncbi:MAG TPA: hypothetical protein VFL78_06715 [Rhodanobacteraceae bacterium]|nr:hypothetical protein [Rhodanobacteraceae bacterium]